MKNPAVDAKVLEVSVQMYRPLVASVCRRYLRDEADVEDAVQETFAKLRAHLHGVHTSLPAWLSATAYTTSNELIRRAIRERRRRRALRHLPPSPDRAMKELIHHQLHRALAAMGESSRRLIVERFFRKTPLRLLADSREESIATVGRRVASAVAELGEILRGMGVSSLDPATLLESLGHGASADSPSPEMDGLRFAPDWRAIEQATLPAMRPGATPTATVNLPGWTRPMRVGVMVSHRGSITPARTPIIGGVKFMEIEAQAMTAQLMRHPGLELVGIVEPGTDALGPVERVLRDYELTAGLIDATDAASLQTLDVILFGMNWRSAPGVSRALHQAVRSGVGLLNEWWVDMLAPHVDVDVCALMLAEPPVYEFHTPHVCGPELPATVIREHPLLPGLRVGATLSVVGCGPVYRTRPGAIVLATKDVDIPPEQHGIAGLGTARMPVCVVGQVGRGRVYVTHILRQAALAATLSAPAEDYLLGVLRWLAEPRRTIAPTLTRAAPHI